MNDLHDRAVRAAQDAANPAQRRRRAAADKAEASKRESQNRLLREAREFGPREFGAGANWHKDDQNGVLAIIEGVTVRYLGNGKFSHSLVTLGQEIAANETRKCDWCLKEFGFSLAMHKDDDCRKAPLSIKVMRILRKVFVEGTWG